jgi:SAM-dependent methyltransferase
MGASPRSIVVARIAVAAAAGLLFVVQPLAGRLVLPAFGGGPGTWAATLAFFQLALLVGYGYAHWAVTRLGPRRSGLVHAALATVAVGVAALSPTQPASLRPPGLEPALAVLVVHAATVGPAVVLLAATTPLLTGWLAADPSRGARGVAGATTGGSVGSAGVARPTLHRLYAFSNAGALAALLLYPTVVEPNLGLAEARRLWLGGLAGVAVLVAALGVAVAVRGSIRGSGGGWGRSSNRPTAARATVAAAWRWALLAAIPAGLLNATTTLLTLDLGAVPLLWVLPLAVYLATFVLAFSALGERLRGPVDRLAPVALTLLWLPLASSAPWSVLPFVGVLVGGLFVVALALHGALAAARPPDARLSGYYLAIAAGGAAGGSFAGIVAPLLFPDLWELPILVVAAILVAGWPARRPAAEPQPGTALGRGRPTPPPDDRTPPRPDWLGGAVWRLNRYVLVGILVLVGLVADRAPAADPAILWFLGGALVLAAGGRPVLFAGATGVLLAVAMLAAPGPNSFAGRSFFGVLEVRPSPDRSVIQLWNGTTLHGTQPTDPARRLAPTGYYVEAGPAGDLFRAVRAVRTVRRGDPLEVGVVGLGVGGLVAYAEPGDRWLVVEIDPLVVRIATDPRLFTYLAAARAPVDVVVDDGRLALARTPAARFDLLVLDAFASDAIPTHLVTAEAIADALRTVRPGGLLAAQLSNRYYDLVPAVAGAAELAGARVLVRDYRPSTAEVARGAFPSRWLVAGWPGPALDALAAAGWTGVVAAPPLTDDRPNLLRFLRWSFG